jgi:hypothetical protein
MIFDNFNHKLCDLAQCKPSANLLLIHFIFEHVTRNVTYVCYAISRHVAHFPTTNERCSTLKKREGAKKRIEVVFLQGSDAHA